MRYLSALPDDFGSKEKKVWRQVTTTEQHDQQLRQPPLLTPAQSAKLNLRFTYKLV